MICRRIDIRRRRKMIYINLMQSWSLHSHQVCVRITFDFNCIVVNSIANAFWCERQLTLNKPYSHSHQFNFVNFVINFWWINENELFSVFKSFSCVFVFVARLYLFIYFHLVETFWHKNNKMNNLFNSNKQFTIRKSVWILRKLLSIHRPYEYTIFVAFDTIGMLCFVDFYFYFIL